MNGTCKRMMKILQTYKIKGCLPHKVKVVIMMAIAFAMGR